MSDLTKANQHKITSPQIEAPDLLLDPGPADTFYPGHNLDLKFWNFRAYEFGHYKPSPSINYIVGPDGGGKLTFLCAVSLILGGTPEQLGKKLLSSFVKEGQDSSSIEIRIMNQDGLDLVIKRTFTRAEMSASSWFLDGRGCTQEDVISIVSKLNVQPDNLFQFNPQNSLGDLGLMRGSERLQEVVRSIGVAELFESHQKLIELDGRLDGYGSKSESEEEIAQINLCIEKLASSWSTELEPVVAKVSEIYKELIGRIVSDGEVVKCAGGWSE